MVRSSKLSAVNFQNLVEWSGKKMGKSWTDEFNATIAKLSQLNRDCRHVYKVFQSKSPVQILSLDGTKVATLLALYFPVAFEMYAIDLNLSDYLFYMNSFEQD